MSRGSSENHLRLRITLRPWVPPRFSDVVSRKRGTGQRNDSLISTRGSLSSFGSSSWSRVWGPDTRSQKRSNNKEVIYIVWSTYSYREYKNILGFNLQLIIHNRDCSRNIREVGIRVRLLSICCCIPPWVFTFTTFVLQGSTCAFVQGPLNARKTPWRFRVSPFIHDT